MRLSADAKGRLKSGNRFSDGLMFTSGLENAQGSLKTRQPLSAVISAQTEILFLIIYHIVYTEII